VQRKEQMEERVVNEVLDDRTPRAVDFDCRPIRLYGLRSTSSSSPSQFRLHQLNSRHGIQYLCDCFQSAIESMAVVFGFHPPLLRSGAAPISP